MKMFYLNKVDQKILAEIKVCWEALKPFGILAIGEGTYGAYANKLPTPIDYEVNIAPVNKYFPELKDIEHFHIKEYKIKLPNDVYAYEGKKDDKQMLLHSASYSKVLEVWFSKNQIQGAKRLEYLYMKSTLQRGSPNSIANGGGDE